MNDPETYPTEAPAESWVIILIVILSVSLSTFVMLDYYWAEQTANTIGEVTAKEFRTPDSPGQTPYFLAIRVNGKAYHVRVSKSYHNQVNKGSMILVAEQRGRFTNALYKSWLFDEMILLEHAAITPKNTSITNKVAGGEASATDFICTPKTSCPDLTGRAAFLLTNTG